MIEIMQLSDMDSGYRGSPEDWFDFISCWNKEAKNKFIKEESELQKHLRTKPNSLNIKLPEIIDNKNRIIKIENKIGKKLPKSFKDFLSGTDSNTGYVLLVEEYEPFLKAEQIDFLKKTNPLQFSIWYNMQEDIYDAKDKEYYTYDLSKQNPITYCVRYVNQVVQVGRIGGQATLLLNPCEKTKDGEWEAWLLSGRLPGAERYKSFAHMMYYNYFIEIHNVSIRDMGEMKNTCADMITIGLP